MKQHAHRLEVEYQELTIASWTRRLMRNSFFGLMLCPSFAQALPQVHQTELKYEKYF